MEEQPSDNSPSPAGVKHCYRCGTELPADAELCSRCGRTQFRTCYCGKEIAVDSPTCPYCGADWSGSRRVHKSRRRRSGKVRPRELVKSAAIGAGAAIGIVGLLTILLRYFAMIATGGAKLPPDVFAQLGLARQGLGIVAGEWGEWFQAYRLSLLFIGAVLVIGGIIGVSTYLANKSIIRLGSASRSSSHGHSSRRRRSTSK